MLDLMDREVDAVAQARRIVTALPPPPHIRPATPAPPEESDEWGDPDGVWVDELYEYTPRHATIDD